MMEEQWNACTDVVEMLKLLPAKAGDRRLRLFACACGRRLWHLWDDLPGERLAVEVAEQFADGLATAGSLEEAGAAAEPVPIGGQGEGGAGHNCTRTDAWDAARVVSSLVAEAAGLLSLPGGEWEERRAQAELLRDIVGHSLRPAKVDRAWLEWDGELVLRLANAAYDDRFLPSGHLDTQRLSVLADAIEDAGCTDAELLDHLRGPGPHTRGCWAIDLLTSRD